ncbi:MAG: septum formation initiator family protein [Gemmatimonadales bacterium]|nr:septum formation initiator family protein [Gemmatimonadales bacterium]
MFQPGKINPTHGFVRGPQSDRSLARRSLFLIIGAFLATLLGLSLLGENGLGSWIRLQAVDSRLENDVASIKDGNRKLTEKLHSLETDPGALEKIAREEYNMQKPGEEILIILPMDTDKDTSP